MPGDILETIDGALSDWVSSDAMRWRPEGGGEHKPAGLPTWIPGVDVLPHGRLDFCLENNTPAFNTALADLHEGDIMVVDDREYHVTAVTCQGNVYTFDLEPAR